MTRWNTALRDGLVAGLIVLFVSSIIGVIVYDSGAKGLKQEVQSYISSLAASAAQFTDGDAHQQITKPEDQGTPLYEQVRAPYFRLLRANPNIAYIYTVIKKDGHIYFVLDSSIPKPGEKQDTSQVMEQYDDATDTMKAALDAKAAMVEDESYTDDWGTFLSAYAPIYNSAGTFLGIVGADIRLTDYNARLARIRNAFAAGMALAAVASFIVGIGVWYVRKAALMSEHRNREQQAELIKIEKARIEQQERSKIEAEKQKRETMNAVAESFESSIKNVVAEVAASSVTIREGLSGIATIAHDTRDRSTVVADASTEAAHMSSQIAAAAEELTASVKEISAQSQKSRGIAVDASDTAQEAQKIIESLAGKASEVGDIISVITGIASQINLLALNATIESARAGEAGRGFAVVASEVKNLANQVASATDTISKQIGEMQMATSYSVDAVTKIINIIAQVSESASSVAAAVEEQSAVTNEIASNISRASVGVQKISSEIHTVQDGAEQVGETTRQVVESAETLSTRSTLLRRKVDEFLTTIRTS